MRPCNPEIKVCNALITQQGKTISSSGHKTADWSVISAVTPDPPARAVVPPPAVENRARGAADDCKPPSLNSVHYLCIDSRKLCTNWHTTKIRNQARGRAGNQIQQVPDIPPGPKHGLEVDMCRVTSMEYLGHDSASIPWNDLSRPNWVGWWVGAHLGWGRGGGRCFGSTGHLLLHGSWDAFVGVAPGSSWNSCRLRFLRRRRLLLLLLFRRLRRRRLLLLLRFRRRRRRLISRRQLFRNIF